MQVQTPERKQIGNKFHRFAQDALTSVTITRGQDLSAESQTKMIPKYAPRYIKELPITSLSYVQLVKDLKRVKIIKSASENFREDSIGNRWRLAFQNKFKSVRKYKSNKQEWESIEKYKAFSKITNVVLHDEVKKKGLSSEKEQKKSASFSWNLLKYIPGMINLNCLDFHIDSKKTHPETLKRLNKLIPNLLSSLETVRVSLEVSPINFWNFSEVAENPPLLSSLIENKNILKRLTHLDLDRISGKDFSSNFELLSKDCKNLVFLSMGFLAGNDAKSLRFLKDFEKIESVKLSPQNLLVFLENFTLPPSVRDVEICLLDAIQHDLYKDNKTEARRQNLVDFCEKWKGLRNLVSLKISATHIPEAVSFIQSLVNMILTSIPSLVNFQFQFLDVISYQDFQDKKKIEIAHSFDLKDIFKALQGFSHQIQKINIQYPQSYGFTWASSENMNLNFPKLTLLQLENNPILNVETISNLFCALQKPSFEDFPQDNVEIFLDNLIVDSNLTLMNLVQTLRKPPRNSTIELAIRIERLDFDTFDEMLGEFIEKAKMASVVENVWLTVKIPSDFDDEQIEVLSFLEEMFANVFFEPLEWDLEENYVD